MNAIKSLFFFSNIFNHIIVLLNYIMHLVLAVPQ